MAERAGFEPAVPLLEVRVISNDLVSTTHPPLQAGRVSDGRHGMARSFWSSLATMRGFRMRTGEDRIFRDGWDEWDNSIEKKSRIWYP